MQLTKEMMNIKFGEVRRNPHQARKYFDKGKLQMLSDSIKEIGVDTPIELVWHPDKDDGKKATLKDGERRYRALGISGYTVDTIMVYGTDYIIKDIKDGELRYRGLIAGCMREDLQPAEKGDAFLQILKCRGITNIDMAISSVNRAKDWTDNGFLAEPSSRNYFVQKETIKQVAKDMKMIGVSGTNAVDLLKILRLPKDIRMKIFFAPPNSKIFREKMKLNRFGKMTQRKGNDRGEMIPISFAREFARLNNDKILRFFLRTSIKREWTSRKLTLIVNDYLGSNLSPEQYIEAYERGCKQSVRAIQSKHDELSGLIGSIDKMSSTLTSWRIINLIAIADSFKQKEFAISSKGLLATTTKLKNALQEILLTTKKLAKIKESERKILNIPFTVTLTKPPKQRNGFRFTIPVDLAMKINAGVGDTLEIQINAVIKPCVKK